MMTMEQTSLGEFEVCWGITDPDAKLAALGVVYSTRDAGITSVPLFWRDPRHGEATPVHLHHDRNGNAYAIGEITNGVWVVGTVAASRSRKTLVPIDELASAVRSGRLFVAKCDGSEIRIECRKDTASRFLESRGYGSLPAVEQEEGGEKRYVVRTHFDEVSKAAEMMALRDLGIPFSGGKEWNPCEVFENLRERGLASGGYWSIRWHGPGMFRVAWNEQTRCLPAHDQGC